MTHDADQQARAHTILGQKYAYATVSLILAIASFVNIAGFEKAILAIIFARLALKSDPAPALTDRRQWGKAGLVLGILQILVFSAVLIIFRNELREVFEALRKLKL
ncbi:MAG: hypothetical protein ACREA2_16660 [Blastocatellia bacterium]